MPTISEDGSNDRDSYNSGDDANANFEQLMVNMLDERDKLMETLRETQENYSLAQAKLGEMERERDAFQTQLQATTPRVSPVSSWFHDSRCTWLVANDGDLGALSGFHGNANGALMDVVILVNVNNDITDLCESNTAAFAHLFTATPVIFSSRHDCLML